jgi:D-lyxose ketol-isomerase
MKRSEINVIMQEANEFLHQMKFNLPPFAYWDLDEWYEKGDEVYDIIQLSLGWDITDFESYDFSNVGLFLFTLRNGVPGNLMGCVGKVYCEKILIVGENQLTPLHFHWKKTEDIINQGGGKLTLQLYNVDRNENLIQTDVKICVDGSKRFKKAGHHLELNPGESVTLPPYCYHNIWGVDDRVLVGEVSTVNDDQNDNRFYEKRGRFPDIEEDEPPLCLLVSDYEKISQ